MTGNGLLVAGDAAALCLAAGIWLEGVNFAMASGMYAGQTALEAITDGDVSQRGLGGYARRLSDTFVLRDHRKLRRAPELVLSDRVQHLYPSMVTGIAERMFRVDNPSAKPGLRRIVHEERKRAGVNRARPVARRPRCIQELRMTDRDETWPEISFSDRMATVEFKVSDKPHIVVDGKACADCSTRECIVACPADLFVPTSDGGILFNYEQCFECGTCYLVCNREGAISWSYPEGGFGVIFRSTLMIAVCIKWIGASVVSGISAADEAAIELALQHGAATRSSVIAVTVGGIGADHGLRSALASRRHHGHPCRCARRHGQRIGRRRTGTGRRPQHLGVVRRLFIRPWLGQRAGLSRRAAATTAGPRPRRPSSSSIHSASLAGSTVDGARCCASPARLSCRSRARPPACAGRRCAPRSPHKRQKCCRTAPRRCPAATLLSLRFVRIAHVPRVLAAPIGDDRTRSPAGPHRFVRRPATR